MNAEPPASSSGKYDPSDTILVFPFLIAVAIAAQLSSGSMILSTRTLGDDSEASKAAAIKLNGPLYGSKLIGSKPGSSYFHR